MAWPDDDLTLEVAFAFGADPDGDPDGWTWTDVSDRLQDRQIRIRAGRSSGAGSVSTSTATVLLDNDDGALTPLHPMSPHYPDVVLSVPLRIRVDPGSGWVILLGGWIDQWEPVYVPSTDGIKALMRVTASGILRRLEQGTEPDLSAMHRTILGSGALAYWPIADGVLSGQAASAIPGHPAMLVTGVTEFTDDLSIAGAQFPIGSSAVADLSGGGQLSVTMPADVTAATVSEFGVDVAARVRVSDASADVVVAEWATPGGTFVRWQLVLGVLTGTRVLAYTSAGAVTTVVTSGGSVTTSFTIHDVSLTQNGGNIDAGLYWSTFDGAYLYSGSVAGTLAGIGALTINATGVTATVPLPAGHVAVRATAPPVYQLGADVDAYGGIFYHHLFGWRNEPAHLRLQRICDEAGVPVTVPAVSDDAMVTRMGMQPATTLSELLQEIERTHLGVLHEEPFGLGYLPRENRYNPPVALTVDLATYQTADGTGSPISPIYDDQGVRNEWTVERSSGSTAVAADAVHQVSRRRYQDSVEVNTIDDTPLMDHAAMLVHLGTVDEMREQTAEIDLAANPELLDAWLACGIGSRIVWTNPPSQHPPGDIDRLLEGWTQVIGPRSWLVQPVTSPASPWLVAEADGDQWVPVDGSTLSAGIDVDDLTLSLASTAANGVWLEGDTVSHPTDFPLDLRIGGVNGVGGERVTCTGISGATSPQTVTLSARGVNGVSRAWDAGTSVDMRDPAISPL
jgi:hypothetical protein